MTRDLETGTLGLTEFARSEPSLSRFVNLSSARRGDSIVFDTYFTLIKLIYCVRVTSQFAEFEQSEPTGSVCVPVMLIESSPQREINGGTHVSCRC